MEPAKLTNNIRRLRFENGEMTQKQLADAVQVTRQTIIALEAFKYNPSLILAIKIARAFGKSVDDVFEYQDRKRLNFTFTP